ncbi:MAG: hypothetical protein JST06_08450 [Bacteroidetes bacterium]|nr:hypothetical protein [Bacteroidota bacterium]MBS1628433.1 hypothetical protein [Bacteroidota bacterium]
MKRLAVFLLALLYLASGAGFTLRTHYCMGQPVSARISHSARDAGSHRCPYCGMEKNGHKGCCHDELKFFKCCSDQVPAEMPTLPAPALAAIIPAAFPVPPHFIDFEAYELALARTSSKFSDGPPRYLSQLLI